ncbi:Lipase [Methanosarcina horonobensis HB-1 = JCM 15518]|uniref:Lipase n=1 Tax=Methanosarcina horonobensis HB-1 = JCM 15518 TaxID=1434110 RepID=A0A0E3S996_9EURY|nr:alpha/beta hydrolase [Methanosarcina horonobensis]AKB78134.1 Lipase [Methanosarcina horonobensis HB-1 = JCM 15518]
MNHTIELLEPATREFVENVNKQGGTPIYKLSPKDARKVLSDLQASDVAKLPADIEDMDIPVGPQGKVSIRILRPEGSKENLPVVMYFHGAGWVLGGKDTHDRLVREIANGANAAVVFVNFTPAPEAKYPAQIEEAYAATKYIAENGKELRLDSSRLAVAGDSVGGNMVAAVMLLVKERGGPKIDYQVLFYPVTDANFDTQSYQQYSTGIWLTREAMKWFWDNYLPDEEARKQPTASPLQASIEQLKGQPPALIITDENDVLRDEGEAYAHKLIQAGVNVTAVRYMGTIHDFVMLNALAGTPATCSAVGLANENLKIVFARS